MTEPAYFDQRPGLFEATRGLIPCAVLRRGDDDNGWAVVLVAGQVTLATLSIERAEELARELARELVAMAALARGNWPEAAS